MYILGPIYFYCRRNSISLFFHTFANIALFSFLGCIRGDASEIGAGLAAGRGRLPQVREREILTGIEGNPGKGEVDVR